MFFRRFNFYVQENRNSMYVNVIFAVAMNVMEERKSKKPCNLVEANSMEEFGKFLGTSTSVAN